MNGKRISTLISAYKMFHRAISRSGRSIPLSYLFTPSSSSKNNLNGTRPGTRPELVEERSAEEQRRKHEVSLDNSVDSVQQGVLVHQQGFIVQQQVDDDAIPDIDDGYGSGCG